MKQMKVGALLLIALFTSLTGLSDATDSAATITITGTVTSDDAPYNPIAGIKVVATKDGVSVAEARTNKEGMYTLKGIPSGGKITIEFSHSAWNTLVESNVPGDKDRTIDKRLESINETRRFGRITAVKTDKGQITFTMTDAKGKEHDYTVPADTKVSLEGKEGRVDDVKAGDRVAVTTKINDPDKTAKIDIKNK